MSKLQDAVSAATKGSTGGFLDHITGRAALRDLRKQYFNSLSFANPKVGIPDRVEEAYNARLKHHHSRLWSAVIKVASSGFGKGVLITTGIILAGGALLFGLGASAGMLTVGGIAGETAATFAQGVAIGLAQAGNAIFTAGGGIALAIGGTLGAVSDVRKHHNKITAEIAKIQAENFAREREENLAKEIKLLKDAALNPTKSIDSKETFEAKSEDKNQFTTREMLRREAQADNPYRDL